MRQECSESTREKRIATYTIKSNQSVNYRSKDVRRMNTTTESWISYGTLTWYASKYKTHNSADTSSASCFISHLATHLGMNCSFVEFSAVSGLRLRFSQRQECFKDIFDWVWIKFTFWHCWVLDFFCFFYNRFGDAELDVEVVFCPYMTYEAVCVLKKPITYLTFSASVWSRFYPREWVRTSVFWENRLFKSNQPSQTMFCQMCSWDENINFQIKDFICK